MEVSTVGILPEHSASPSQGSNQKFGYQINVNSTYSHNSYENTLQLSLFLTCFKMKMSKNSSNMLSLFLTIFSLNVGQASVAGAVEAG